MRLLRVLSLALCAVSVGSLGALASRPHVAPLAPHHVHSQKIALANAHYALLHSQLESAFAEPSKVAQSAAADKGFGYTPSATPLIVLSPEVSVWSSDDDLFTRDTRHWAGQSMSMTGALLVDGQVFGFLGNASAFSGDGETSAMQQTNKMVLPTSTIYQFTTPTPAGQPGAVSFQLLFSQVVDDLGSETELSKPYSYVTFSVNNTGSTALDLSLYFDVHADWVLDAFMDSSQNIGWADISPANNAFVGLSVRNYDNIPFSRKGDYVKTNWGSMFLASNVDGRLTRSISGADAMRRGFGQGQSLPILDPSVVRAFNNDPVSAAFQWSFGSVAAGGSTGAFVVLGYDDEFSMNYFGEWQAPLWRHTFNNDLGAMVVDALQSFQPVLQRLLNFDQALFKKLQSAGGDSYAILTCLAYRQVTGGIKGVWSESLGESRWYMKEISSDGDISTVDVIYPASPFFLAFGPEILRKMLLPLLDYALNRTNIPYGLSWAPHHLGYWPVADITQSQQEQMPMEESANFFLMLSGIVRAQDNSVAWLADYWPLLSTWGNYLNSSLPDPGNQLCTDDFEGPSPHNVNLALKGVVGLGAYAQLLAANGQAAEAKVALQAAEGFAAQWMTLSGSAAGGPSRLQFDLPESFSQKYNLLFHYVLQLSLFDAPQIMSQEIAYYKTQQTVWGLPLDSRGPLTKSDWTSWIAAMSVDAAYSATLFDAELTFLMTGPSKAVPFSDWYSTADGHVLGFQARPVQGGLFAKYLLTMLPQASDEAEAAAGAVAEE